MQTVWWKYGKYAFGVTNRSCSITHAHRGKSHAAGHMDRCNRHWVNQAANCCNIDIVTLTAEPLIRQHNAKCHGDRGNKNRNLLHAIVPAGGIYSNHLRRVNQTQIYAFIVLPPNLNLSLALQVQCIKKPQCMCNCEKRGIFFFMQQSLNKK